MIQDTNSSETVQSKPIFFLVSSPEFYKLSDLVDYIFHMSGRNPTDWGYKRTDLRLNPFIFAKQLAMSRLPLGRTYFGSPSLDALERVRLEEESCSKIADETEILI